MKLVGKACDDVQLTAETLAANVTAVAHSNLDMDLEDAPTIPEEEKIEAGAINTHGKQSYQFI